MLCVTKNMLLRINHHKTLLNCCFTNVRFVFIHFLLNCLLSFWPWMTSNRQPRSQEFCASFCLVDSFVNVDIEWPWQVLQFKFNSCSCMTFNCFNQSFRWRCFLKTWALETFQYQSFHSNSSTMTSLDGPDVGIAQQLCTHLVSFPQHSRVWTQTIESCRPKSYTICTQSTYLANFLHSTSANVSPVHSSN